MGGHRVTEIQDKYLVTDDIDVQWLFLGTGATHLETRFMRSLVLSALKPVVGKAYFIVLNYQRDTRKPIYRLSFEAHDDEQVLFVAVNALTIGKNCGEIRKLLAWAEGKT
jgi:hypothetical protein